MIEQHAFGEGGEKGARFDDRCRFAGAEHANEGVLGQICGAVRAAESAPQPAGEPAVVVKVERFDGMGGRQGYYSGRMIDALENKNCSHCRGV
jgi:hypothetical protein